MERRIQARLERVVAMPVFQTEGTLKTYSVVSNKSLRLRSGSLLPAVVDDPNFLFRLIKVCSICPAFEPWS